MKIAYFDCFSGISGDMILGALLDLGLSEKVLVEALAKIPVKGYGVLVTREKRGSIGGTRIVFEIGHGHARSYRDIREIVGNCGLEERVRTRSLDVFDRLARAEGRVHQVPPEEVHFHEVGALDSILDIVGAVFAVEHLGIGKIVASPLPTGRGFVKTHHGTMPVPAPATTILLEGVPVYDNGVERELVTPTGAALLATLADSFGPLPDMTLEGTGYGVGSHPASDPPNLLRVMVGTARPPLLRKTLLLLETNIDDMNPEIYNYVLEELFSLGVLDVNFVPVQMKKNRPAVLLRVLLEPGLRAAVTDLLFRETTTLGVRFQEVERVELPREAATLQTPYGPCRVKRVWTPDGEERSVPEFEECRRIARERGVPIRKVYEEILLSARRG
ncbi:MAG: nickel pincer cofactor biosynthesis protein LarC [Syntrophobacteraceae bacterium]